MIMQFVVAAGFFGFSIYAIFFTEKFKELNRKNGLNIYKKTGLKIYKKSAEEALDQSSLYIRLFASVFLILSIFMFSELMPGFSLYSLLDMSSGAVFMFLWAAGAIIGGGYSAFFYSRTQTGRARDFSIVFGVFFMGLGLWNLWAIFG